jgi:hypothetical protein
MKLGSPRRHLAQVLMKVVNILIEDHPASMRITHDLDNLLESDVISTPTQVDYLVFHHISL